MGTDRLEAINTVEEVLSDPSAPPTYFDEEPDGDAALASEKGAKASDDLRSGSEIPKDHFGKLGSLSKEMHEAHAVRDGKNESVGTVRQALAEQTLAASPTGSGRQMFTKLSQETASPRLDPNSASIDTLRLAASDKRTSPGGWLLRGFVGMLLAAGIGGSAATWFGSSGDAEKRALQPGPPIQAGPTASPPELTAMLQSMSRDLTNLGKEIEQFKLGREQTARDNADLREQLKANQEQLTGVVARLSDQLKASQDLAARDNANAAEQIKAIKDQLIRIEQNAPPRIVAPPPRVATPAAHKPAPTPSSPQVTAQPVPAKPKPPAPATLTSRPPAPAPAAAR